MAGDFHQEFEINISLIENSNITLLPAIIEVTMDVFTITATIPNGTVIA